MDPGAIYLTHICLSFITFMVKFWMLWYSYIFYFNVFTYLIFEFYCYVRSVSDKNFNYKINDWIKLNCHLASHMTIRFILIIWAAFTFGQVFTWIGKCSIRVQLARFHFWSTFHMNLPKLLPDTTSGELGYLFHVLTDFICELGKIIPDRTS